MKESEYEFIFQSRLQRFYYVLSIIAGAFIFSLPIAILANYLPYLNSADWLLGVLMVLGLVLALLGLYIGGKIGIRWISHGTLHLYSDHAMLHYGNKTLQLEMKEFCIKTGQANHRSFYPQEYYEICMDGQKVRFYEAVKKFWLRCYDPSLGEAMMELLKSGLPTPSREVLSSLKEIEKKMGMTSSPSSERTFNIGDIVITKRSSTPAVFAGSPYYVDYIDSFMPQDEPACGCYVREVADPEHVVAEIFFEDDKDHKAPKTESILSKSVILYGVVLDERIGLT